MRRDWCLEGIPVFLTAAGWVLVKGSAEVGGGMEGAPASGPVCGFLNGGGRVAVRVVGGSVDPEGTVAGCGLGAWGWLHKAPGRTRRCGDTRPAAIRHRSGGGIVVSVGQGPGRARPNPLEKVL